MPQIIDLSNMPLLAIHLYLIDVWEMRTSKALDFVFLVTLNDKNQFNGVDLPWMAEH